MARDQTDVAQLALDALGINYELGDLEDGGRIENIMLRQYGECLRQLLRAAPWTFARKQASLVLLADASGNTPNVNTSVPGGQFVYEYAYPIDCARIRYIPWYPLLNPTIPAGNITPPTPGSPVVLGLSVPPASLRPRPSRFLVTNDPNITAPAGSNAPSVQGQSPIGNTVILSNVPNASCVYTFNALYVGLWDHLFQAAMVAYLASEVALPLYADKDRKFGLAMRSQQIVNAKAKLNEARVLDGNEMTVSADIPVDWMQFRRTGGTWAGIGGYGSGGEWGCFGGGWNGALGFSDGTAY